jgi:hypothetical protein
MKLATPATTHGKDPQAWKGTVISSSNIGEAAEYGAGGSGGARIKI